MTSREIRQSFLDFFKSKQHTIVHSAPVIPHGDPTLLFTNAGMNQFKEIFLGTGKRDYTRAADTQKCIRVSGKHNDLEEVGRDTYHHTLFEMLGNWSFGDYYKEEAIAWAWELLTERWKMPKERLWITVYKTDDEAARIWEKYIDPSRILRFGEKENFWEMGDTGPCGPCSEIHIDLTQRGDAPEAMVNAGSPELIEIWNLVFIQYNRNADGSLTELPAKHVDTGMGFERVCAVMESMKSDFKRFPSNYDSDVFTPIIDQVAKISSVEYKASHSDTDVAMRVIADHIRALTFAIGDGASPSNEGRGYVLRRILRRASRWGRKLDLREPFMYKLVQTLVDTMSDVFPEIREHQTHIERVIKSEEESFNQTLDRGLEIFEQTVSELKQSKVFPGEAAFKLYDTFGFPLDLTQLLCSERSLTVDATTFAQLMDAQRERSRDSKLHGGGDISEAERIAAQSKDAARQLPSDLFEKEFQFLGYDLTETRAAILAAEKNLVVLNATPFYAESGGQLGDSGEIVIDGKSFPVIDTQKSGKVHVHILGAELPTYSARHEAQAKVDPVRRYSIIRNHSATHLMHAALRQVLGNHVHQAGSLVAQEYLRFDFAHFAKVTDQEVAAIEEIVNAKISEGIALQHHRAIPFDEAKKMGALMFFGDKYGDRVNVVQFGEFSKEFCGGIHVKNTSEIGFFKVRTEASSASGVRRVEALTHDHALEYLKLQNKSYRERVEYAYDIIDAIQSMHNELGVSSPFSNEEALGLDTKLRRFEDIPEVPASIVTAELTAEFAAQRARFTALENYILELSEKKRLIEKESAKAAVQNAGGSLDAMVAAAQQVDGFRVVSSRIAANDADALKSLGDTLRSKIGTGVGLLASVIDDKVSLVCVVSDDLIKTKNLQAGKIVGAVAKQLNGGGGGKPHLATAGGKDVAKLDDALNGFVQTVKGMVNG
ncbi:MAG: alanine--tRNA ligase [Bacteroidetes bacterium]|nr:alanine--tRNA ligase [Bacteroidota bacterium]